MSGEIREEGDEGSQVWPTWWLIGWIHVIMYILCWTRISFVPAFLSIPRCSRSSQLRGAVMVR